MQNLRNLHFRKTFPWKKNQLLRAQYFICKDISMKKTPFSNFFSALRAQFVMVFFLYFQLKYQFRIGTLLIMVDKVFWSYFIALIIRLHSQHTVLAWMIHYLDELEVGLQNDSGKRDFVSSLFSNPPTFTALTSEAHK